ncbi:phage tail protein [Endothiovibrio diazotrophicus]
MSTPFIGEIKLFAINFAPEDWSVCDGQELPISQNAALFSLLQEQFGGNGNTTFKLPDFRGRVPVHPSGDYPFYQQGFFGGSETVILSQDELPAHRHTAQGVTADGVVAAGVSRVPAKAIDAVTNQPTNNWSAPPANLVEMAQGCISPTGGGQSHANVQPSTVLLFCISLAGLYPQRG